MVNNFDIMSSWFDNLTDQGDFFFVQVIQRKKECNVGSNNNVIKDYHFFDKETFLKKQNEIIILCKAFNARAYFWVNPRNCKQVQFEIIREATEALECNSRKLFNCVSKAIGRRRSSNYNAVWILDFDTTDWVTVNKYLSVLNKCRPDGDKVITSIPTVNGIHILTKGFDLEQFKQQLVIEKLANIDIHKDNPTVLYYE